MPVAFMLNKKDIDEKDRLDKDFIINDFLKLE